MARLADAWNAISVAEQERVIGRSKLDDIELPDEQQPANAHVFQESLTFFVQTTEAGVELTA